MYMYISTFFIEHDLPVEEVSGIRLVLELVNLVVDELSEVLELQQRLQKLFHLWPRSEEPARHSSSTHTITLCIYTVYMYIKHILSTVV